MGSGQLRRYTTDNALVQLDPKVWELPGGMPEISPSPDFGKNIEKRFTERSMALQAWGTYGILWPVVHYELGVSPDIGRDRVSVVPQVPSGQHTVAGQHVRLGAGHVNVTATRESGRLETVVRQSRDWHLTIGALLPDGRPRHGRPARRPPRRSPGAGQRAWSPGRRRRGQRPRRLRPDGALLPLTSRQARFRPRRGWGRVVDGSRTTVRPTARSGRGWGHVDQWPASRASGRRSSPLGCERGWTSWRTCRCGR